MRVRQDVNLSLKRLTVSGLLLSLTFLNACDSSQNTPNCPKISADQTGSFMARVQGYPIQIQMDASFTAAQQQLIQQAAADWNQLAQTTIGQPVFAVSDPITIDPSVRAMDPHDCSQNFGSSNVLLILRETDEAHWESIGFSQQVPGATMRCSNGGTVSEQITIVNTELSTMTASSDSGTGMSDALAKVFTHELGHSLGLDHSCNGNSTVSTATYATCTGLPASNPYHQAVMYPWIEPDAISGDSAQVRTQSAPPSYLQDNDRARGGCMMQSS
jgi:hypothetical protein